MVHAVLGNKSEFDKGGFRIRGRDVTRLEAFTDAVFAFAVTLLVVSLEVPKNYADLRGAMGGFLPFGICFATLISFWYRHYVFFRRYGLEDAVTTALNGALVFVILFYVYPLKFLFTLLTAPLVGGGGQAITGSQVAELFLVYGAGFAGIYLIFALLHLRALKLRAPLGLSPAETALTRLFAMTNLALAAVGILSMAVASLIGAKGGLAGWTYFLIPVVETFAGAREGAIWKTFGRPVPAGSEA
jgi:uncharacterized membrane protein